MASKVTGLYGDAMVMLVRRNGRRKGKVLLTGDLLGVNGRIG